MRIENYQVINKLQSSKIKDAQLDFKRALIRPQKGIFYKPIGRLFKANRPSIKFDATKKYYKSQHQGH